MTYNYLLIFLTWRKLKSYFYYNCIWITMETTVLESFLLTRLCWDLEYNRNNWFQSRISRILLNTIVILEILGFNNNNYFVIVDPGVYFSQMNQFIANKGLIVTQNQLWRKNDSKIKFSRCNKCFDNLNNCMVYSMNK